MSSLDPYTKGYRAARARLFITANPYFPDSPGWENWRAGWRNYHLQSERPPAPLVAPADANRRPLDICAGTRRALRKPTRN